MNTSGTRKGVLFSLVMGLGLAGISPLAVADETGTTGSWQFAGEIYVWGAELDSTTPGGSSVSIPFHDVLDNLEMTFMGALAARKDKWTLLADVIYMDLSDTENFSRSVPNISGSAKATLESWIFSPTLMYNLVDNDRYRLDAVGGLRYLDVVAKLDLNLDLGSDPVNRSGKDSFDNWDGIVGAKVKVYLDKHWSLGAYLDVGGADSESTWQGMATVSYRFDRLEINGGYRYLNWDFDEGDNDLMSELTVKGPFAGVLYRF